jgi:hypothetical protein
MTQVANSPRGQELGTSGYGIAEAAGLALVPALPGQGAPSLLGAGALEPAGAGLGIGLPSGELPDAGEDLLAAVWRTSSYVESMQWELDAAQGSLFSAVQQAAHAGIAHDELCKAANMTAVELAAALQVLPPASPVAAAPVTPFPAQQ